MEEEGRGGEPWVGVKGESEGSGQVENMSIHIVFSFPLYKWSKQSRLISHFLLICYWLTAYVLD